VALVPLPYSVSFYTWAILTLIAFAGALAWAAISRGAFRWIAVGAAIAPWWVLEAVRVGQVAPLVAAGIPIAWRCLREERNVAAGLALSLMLLKPNTAFLVPFALLVAGRFKTFGTLAVVGAVVGGISFLTLGTEGVTAYVSQLTGPLPSGADNLTLEKAIGVQGAMATTLRVVIVVAVLVAAFWLRRSPGMVLAVGILGSLVAVPYLHASDLCLLVVAGWIVWEERPSLAWRVPLAAGWLLTTPFTIVGPPLNKWPVVELAFLLGLVLAAWQVARGRSPDEVAAAA
jgi:alpha-1,2-mannosyltransferase